MQTFLKAGALSVCVGLILFLITLASDLSWTVRISLAAIIAYVAFEISLVIDQQKAASACHGLPPATPRSSTPWTAIRLGIFSIVVSLIVGIGLHDLLPTRWQFAWYKVTDNSLAIDNMLRSQIAAKDKQIEAAQWNNIPMQCVVKVLSKLDANQIKTLPKTIYVMSGDPSMQMLQDNVRLIVDQAISKTWQPDNWVPSLSRAPMP
jgi:hypothetical protein